MAKSSERVDLSTYTSFMKHHWVELLTEKFEKDFIRAKVCLEQLYDHLNEINLEYQNQMNRTLFTTLDGRIKSKKSFFVKLYGKCKNKVKSEGFSQENLQKWYGEITDLAGMRFSTPYYDEVDIAITQYIRPHLGRYGYGTDLNSLGLVDKNYLDEGDENGYRSYHFFVKVPTPVDIYGTVENVICEIQGRSELQHVWAVKSHDLLYKPKKGWKNPTRDQLSDMKQLSESLRSVDHFLVKIRKSVRKK